MANCDLYVVDPGTGNPVFPDPTWPPTLLSSGFDQIAERLTDGSVPGPAVVRIPCGPRPAVALAILASRPAMLVAVSGTEEPPDLFVLRHIAAVAAMEVERLKAEREGSKRLGAEMLADLIDNRGDGSVATRLLTERGLAEEPRALAAFAAGKAGRYPDLRVRLEESGVPHLLGRRSGTFVVLLPHVAHAVETLTEEVGSPVGLSDPVGRTPRVADAHREAMWALQVAQATGRKIVRYGEEATFPFLPRNLEESRAIVRHILGPVLDQDAEYGTALVMSLKTYLLHNRSLKVISEALHVHKQTVVYKMRRVEELTGRRLGRMEDIVNFWLALRALDLLVQGGHGPKQQRERLARLLAEAHAPCGVGLEAMGRGDFGGATSRFEEAITLFVRSDEEGGTADSAARLAGHRAAPGGPPRPGAVPVFEERLSLARRRGDRLGTHDVLYNLAQLAVGRDALAPPVRVVHLQDDHYSPKPRRQANMSLPK